jgi:hypothetical protein
MSSQGGSTDYPIPKVANPGKLFQDTKNLAIRHRERILIDITNDLRRRDRHQFEAFWQALTYHIDVLTTIEYAMAVPGQKTASAEAQTPDIPTFIVGSWFLARCAQFLLSNPQGYERLHLVTGSKLGPKQRTLDHMVEVALDDSSAIHATANQHDLLQKQIEMDERWGHFMHGLFHSHPGSGKEATRPSGTDWKTHERFERGGYPMVGAIFERSGFVRFFSGVPFAITVFGKGVEQHDAHVFKIQPLTRHLPVQPPHHSGQGTSERDSQAPERPGFHPAGVVEC